MRPMLFILLLLSLAEYAFGQSNGEPYSALPLPPRFVPQNDVKLEEQNGQLLQPLLDPKTGKYTFDIERGKKIVEQR
ncbi:MAG TPA: hypothetical protein VLJ15_05285 [Gammaproteobacteria bacterium]|nr:hypothetical protein [Gammaproteobacteria bacterium]